MTYKGKRNPNFKHGKYAFGNTCKRCKTTIDPRSKRCAMCRSLVAGSFKGKKHSVESKKKIGKKSKAKFTKKFLQEIRKKHSGRKKRAINGYTLVKDYKHPNRNCHNDVLEHILIMSTYLGRPIKKAEIIHHKNFIRDDNRRKNLWLYKNASEHGKCTKSLFKLVDVLLKSRIILFKNGKYEIGKIKKHEYLGYS